jgi:hypothetical protein
MKRLISIGFGALLLASTIAVGSQSALAKGNSMKDKPGIERLHHRKHHRRHRRNWRRAHRVRVSKLSY